MRGKGTPGDLAGDLGRELARGGRKGGGDGADLWAMLVSDTGNGAGVRVGEGFGADRRARLVRGGAKAGCAASICSG